MPLSIRRRTPKLTPSNVLSPTLMFIVGFGGLKHQIRIAPVAAVIRVFSGQRTPRS